MTANGTRVYLAAPLFSQAERIRNKSLRDAISRFANVYLPQEDGGLILDLVRDGMPVEQAKSEIFELDIAAIRACDVLVIILDGRTVDEGASFELGYAFALGKTCVGLKTDPRMLLPIGDNPMIEAALRKLFSDDSELVNWIENFDPNMQAS
ncbi:MULTISPECIES: nucleoside 2-deoxyribosyltransferase [unclassified Bradyrhizobium]|uniref:nucleoside 2-deoxyribosyltransferase n=1 Tax=unclassified Bradyrhizobium TaxID=2631580 RepID=UPI001FFAD588|nr:nucleoside 2-deoxyribosyltransferase [Bradyrhizobium sp. 84]MCK1369732.1 nucleoside 2-deoxyribosyltransferase [Bradyrhizobium sp. 49]MCK1430661.1 nucleoside 2-deoxyribosyltransferase [Bradyrhizobium sp. 87]